jgi:hypothetical protein
MVHRQRTHTRQLFAPWSVSGFCNRPLPIRSAFITGGPRMGSLCQRTSTVRVQARHRGCHLKWWLPASTHLNLLYLSPQSPSFASPGGPPMVAPSRAGLAMGVRRLKPRLEHTALPWAPGPAPAVALPRTCGIGQRATTVLLGSSRPTPHFAGASSRLRCSFRSSNFLGRHLWRIAIAAPHYRRGRRASCQPRASHGRPEYGDSERRG